MKILLAVLAVMGIGIIGFVCVWNLRKIERLEELIGALNRDLEALASRPQVVAKLEPGQKVDGVVVHVFSGEADVSVGGEA